MSEESPAKRRIGGWKLLGMIVGGLLLVITGLGWWWYVDDTDLVDFRNRARTAGVPLTWKEALGAEPDRDRLAIWKDLAALIDDKAMKSYQESGRDPKSRKPFAPIPDETRAHHAAMDPKRLARLIDLLDQLGSEPLLMRAEYSFSTSMPEIGRYRSLARLLQERIWLAGDAEVSRESRRLLSLCATMKSPVFVLDLVRVSIIEIALHAISEHLSILRARDPGISEVIDRLGAECADASIRAFTGDLLLSLSLVEKPNLVLGLQGNSLEWRLTARAGRSELMNRQLDWILKVRSISEVIPLLREAKTLDAFSGPEWDPRERLARTVLSGFGVGIHFSYHCRLHAQLVSAELRGLPWPKDSFDPRGIQLRRFERDGRLMGAYTVYVDGVDDGGDMKKDRYFPLYGPREAPKTPP